ncbi:MAG: MFS transporter [Candidatus Dormibacter sp.]
MAVERLETSYAGLLRVPGFARVALGAVLGRLAGQMWEIVLVLFVLQRYHSPALAGAALLLGLLPGLVFSPVAGSLLDRQGRVRLMIFDYSLTATLTAGIAVLSVLHRLTVPLLLAIVTVLSLSNILSITGTRSLFPLMVPRHLWDRSNGLDTSSYSFTAIIGPAVAGLAIAGFGPEAALIATGVVVGIAALSLIGVPEPIGRAASSGSLLGDSLGALRYVGSHRTLRGLAAAMFLTNVAFGPVLIGIPLVVLRRLHGGADTVGQIYAVFGAAGLLAGLLAGRLRTEGRERPLMAICIASAAPAMIALALTNSLPVIFGVAVVLGAGTAVSTLGVFAIRQRRMDPRWFGRGFAVSMSLNMTGQPIGSALSGPLFQRSIALPLILGAGVSLVAAAATMALIPKHEDG